MFRKDMTMRTMLAAIFCVFGTAGLACDNFTSELFPGVRIANYKWDELTISHDGRGSESYYVVSGGTGVPYRVAHNVKKNGETQSVRMVGDKLLISMEVYEPYCPNE
jgi:hypothetical protein